MTPNTTYASLSLVGVPPELMFLVKRYAGDFDLPPKRGGLVDRVHTWR